MNNAAAFMRESSTVRIFIPIGMILFIFGFITFITSSKNLNYIKVNSIVSNVEIDEPEHTDEQGNLIESTYLTIVKYSVKNVEYERSIRGISKHKIGDKLTIYYNPDNPNQITQTKGLLIPLIIMLGGIVSLGFGIIKVINISKKYNKAKGGRNNGK